MEKSQFKGVIFVGLATIIWGTNGIFARSIDLPSPVLLLFRYFFGFLFLLFYFLAKGVKIPKPKKNKKGIMILGIFNALLSVTAFIAFTNTSIASAEILLYSFPVYLLILAPLTLQEKINRSSLFPLALSFTGLVLIAISENMFTQEKNSLGLAAGFLAGLFFALYVLTAKRVSVRYNGSIMNFHQLAITSLILLPGLLFMPFQLNWGKIVLLILMGFFNSALAATLYFTGIKYLKAQQVGVISYLEPLSAVIFALFFFGEIPSVVTILGGILILYGGYQIITSKPT